VNFLYEDIVTYYKIQ